MRSRPGAWGEEMKRLLKVSVLSAATITVLLLFTSTALARDPMPFETLVYSQWQEKAVIGQPHAFGFWLFYPNPNAVVTAGKVVFNNATTRKYVTSVTITGISHYVSRDGLDLRQHAAPELVQVVEVDPRGGDVQVARRGDGERRQQHDVR